MRTITALFDTYDHAASAVRAVRDAGVQSGDISLVANNTAGDYTAEDDLDAEQGAAAGVPALARLPAAARACWRVSAPSPFPASAR